ncbi:MAG TPA: FAD binding domain-containing protein [Thermoanaerobaculia bacterium]|nr:FAD binding domain-containing protein [Thermoanaerobaculia bacterium]
MSVAGLALHPFSTPKTLDEALALLAERSARAEKTVLLAGGTDWFVERHVAPAEEAGVLPLVVDVSRLDALRGIAVEGETLHIGAAATYLEIRKDARVAARCPLLAATARDVGALQIQARGTLGGNLASGSPAADGVAALAALDATLLLRSIRGARRVPLAGFYTGYRRSVLAADELIEAIEIALPPEGSPFAWRKVGTRQAQAISKVAFAGLAVVASGRLARLGLGMASVAPTVALLPATRALGLSKPLGEVTDADVEQAVLADVSPIDDVRSTAAYRRHVAVRLAQRFFGELRAL